MIASAQAARGGGVIQVRGSAGLLQVACERIWARRVGGGGVKVGKYLRARTEGVTLGGSRRERAETGKGQGGEGEELWVRVKGGCCCGGDGGAVLDAAVGVEVSDQGFCRQRPGKAGRRVFEADERGTVDG
jgi:hypothetical protein